MNSYYGRNATPDDDGHDPAHVATVDQNHAMFRDFVRHLTDHCAESLAAGHTQQDVALQLARELETSDHTRETFACLSAVALTDLAYALRDMARGRSRR